VVPVTQKDVVKRIMISSWPRQKFNTLTEKQQKQKKAGGVAQVVVHLSRKHKALSSIPITVKKKL
jgi:hypothetical protein